MSLLVKLPRRLTHTADAQLVTAIRIRRSHRGLVWIQAVRQPIDISTWTRCLVATNWHRRPGRYISKEELFFAPGGAVYVCGKHSLVRHIPWLLPVDIMQLPPHRQALLEHARIAATTDGSAIIEEQHALSSIPKHRSCLSGYQPVFSEAHPFHTPL